MVCEGVVGFEVGIRGGEKIEVVEGGKRVVGGDGWFGEDIGFFGE